MAVINLATSSPGIEVRGRLGKPNGFGDLYFGWSDFGDFNEFAGYYQRRKKQGGQIIVRMRHYTSNGGSSEQQLLNRSSFALGVLAWHDLTLEEKQYYNKLKYPRKMSGFCRFMRLHLRGEL